MLQIRLSSSKAAAAEGGGAAKLPSGETVTVACPDHLVLAELPVAKSLGSANGVTLVKTVGRRSRRPHGERVHFCVQCDSPIAVYGRLSPCEHAFCLDCARSDSICYLCDERIQKIQTIKMMEGILVCAAPHCLKSFLKKSDFESHVYTIHADLVKSHAQKDVNESEAASARKPTTSDSTVQAPTPRPVFSPGANSQVQDREDRSQRPQPPLRPLAPPKPTPPQADNNRPPGFDGPTPMNRFPQQNFDPAAGQQQGIMPEAPYPDYPMNVLQPPNFAVPVNSNLVMGPAPFGQPLYVGPSAPEAGMEQASLLGFPRPWTMGPTGVPFDPSMMANQGGVDPGRVGFYQGAPPPNMVQGNAKDVRDGKGILAAPQPLPPPPPPPPQFAQVRGNFFGGDASHDGQGYGWQQDKRDSFGNGQE